MPEYYVATCVNKADLGHITLSRRCYHSQESTRGANITICSVHRMYIYIYKSINERSKRKCRDNLIQ